MVSASTSGQFVVDCRLSAGQVNFVPPALLSALEGQYDAAANCSKSWRLAKVVSSIAGWGVSLAFSHFVLIWR